MRLALFWEKFIFSISFFLDFFFFEIHSFISDIRLNLAHEQRKTQVYKYTNTYTHTVCQHCTSITESEQCVDVNKHLYIYIYSCIHGFHVGFVLLAFVSYETKIRHLILVHLPSVTSLSGDIFWLDMRKMERRTKHKCDPSINIDQIYSLYICDFNEIELDSCR